MSDPQRPSLGAIVAALHDSEINGEAWWFFDRVWKVKLGDPWNNYDAEAVVHSPEEAAEWLRDIAIKLYPDSQFARLYLRSANDAWHC